jgi:hypothetical protein
MSYLKSLKKKFNENTPLKTQNGNFTHNRGQNKRKGVGLTLSKINDGSHDDDNSDKWQIQSLFKFMKFYSICYAFDIQNKTDKEANINEMV